MARSRLILAVAAFFILAGLVAVLVSGRQKEPVKTSLKVHELLGGVPPDGFLQAIQPRLFRFPTDHGPHPGYRTEWWYFTGNLATASGRRFGYQLTFFRQALVPKPVRRSSRWGTNEVFLAHFALTDVAGKKFYATERFSRAAVGLAGAGGRPLVVHLEEWSAREVAAKPWTMQLSAADQGVAIDLTVRAVTDVVPNGERGLSRKGSALGNASYYYSIPRMVTEGVIRVGGERLAVSGLSWLDREWSTSALEAGEVGWDWFALQLVDGRDLMFYRLRRGDGSTAPFSSGTLVAADGSRRHLQSDEVRLESLGWWQSPGGRRYPARWRVTVPGSDLDLEVIPLLADQEHRGTIPYWEGAVGLRDATGRPAGYGYVELTGYGD